MAVMAPPRESWTDERLDDLKEHMDAGFRDLRGEIREVRGEIGGVRGEVVELRSELGQVREGLGEVRAEIKGINKTLQVGFGLIGSFLGVLGILIATQM
jgi:chromosome segregation ATPase